MVSWAANAPGLSARGVEEPQFIYAALPKNQGDQQASQEHLPVLVPSQRSINFSGLIATSARALCSSLQVWFSLEGRSPMPAARFLHPTQLRPRSCSHPPGSACLPKETLTSRGKQLDWCGGGGTRDINFQLVKCLGGDKLELEESEGSSRRWT